MAVWMGDEDGGMDGRWMRRRRQRRGYLTRTHTKTCISELVGGKDRCRKAYHSQNSTTGRGNGRDGEENVGAERKRYDDDESEAKEKR